MYCACFFVTGPFRCEPRRIRHDPGVILEVVEGEDSGGAFVPLNPPSSVAPDSFSPPLASAQTPGSIMSTGPPLTIPDTAMALDSQSAADAHSQRMEGMQKQLVEPHERSHLAQQEHSHLAQQEHSHMAQQEALGRIALIQSKAAAIMTQNHELYEYPIPRLFIVLPEEATTNTEKLDRGIKNQSTRTFKVHFLCECGDHTKPVDGQATNTNLKHEIHIACHKGYDIVRPTEFFEKYSSYILTLLQMLKYGVAIPGVAVQPSDRLQIVDSLKNDAEEIGCDFKDIGKSIDSSIAYIEGLAGVQSQPPSSGPYLSANSSALVDAEDLEGADFLQLYSFLETKGDKRELGNLYRTVTAEGHNKWVCLDHYRVKNKAKAAQDLRNAMDEIGEEYKEASGVYIEATGSVRISLPSRTVARKFYEALSSLRDVQELDIALCWYFSMQDLVELRDAIKSTPIFHVRLDGRNGGSLPPDFLNNGRRFDPVLQMLSGGNIRKFELTGWEGFLGSINNIPATLSVRELRIDVRSHEEWSKQISRFVEILQVSPLLTKLNMRVAKGFKAVLDHLAASLEGCKLSQGLTLEMTDLLNEEANFGPSEVSVEFEAGTGRTLWIDVTISNAEETNLFDHPSVRKIEFFDCEELFGPLRHIRRCLGRYTGLEMVFIGCSKDTAFDWMEILQELFAKHPQHTPQVSLTDSVSTVSTSNIQDPTATEIDIRDLRNSTISKGYLTNAPRFGTCNIETVSFDNNTTWSDVNALVRFWNSQPEYIDLTALEVCITDRIDPEIYNPLFQLLEQLDILEALRVRCKLESISNNETFHELPGHHGSIKYYLQGYSTCIQVSGRLLPIYQPTTPEPIFGAPFRRLLELQVILTMSPPPQDLSWILSTIQRNCPPGPHHHSTKLDREGHECNRIRGLYLKECRFSDIQWPELIESIDFLTLNLLSVNGWGGFTETHLAYLVDRCIETVTRVMQLPEEPESLADQLAVQDLWAQTHKRLRICLCDVYVTNDYINEQNEKLTMLGLGWIQLERGV